MFKITPKNFPNQTELNRITTLRKFRSLYEGEQYAVLGLHNIIKNQYNKESDIVYLANPIPARVSDFYGDFVAGDPEKMIIKAGDNIKEHEDFVSEVLYQNDLKEKINDIGTVQSEFGFVALLGWLDEAEQIFHIDEIPQDQYFPQADGSVVIATYKADPDDKSSNPRLLLFTKHYRIEGNNCIIERAAWKTESTGVISESYPLQSMASIMGLTLEPLTTLEELNDIPIRQVDNTNRNRWGFGKSDYADIIPQLAEINERMTHVSTQLLKNLDAKMMIPRSMLDEDGKVKAFDAIAVETKDDPEAKYIINDNPLLGETREHILTQAKMISFATSVPMFELLKTATPERVESLKIQLFAASRRTSRKRARITRAIKDMFLLGFQMKKIEFKGDISIKFSDVIPIDELTQAETESTKIRAGISSRKSAIMRVEGFTPDEADAELKQIQEEDRLIGMFGGTPPKVGDNLGV